MITITTDSGIAYRAQDALRRAGSPWPTVMQIAEPGAGELLDLARAARGDEVFSWLTTGLVHLT